jgi:hypothetical protein
MKKLGLRLTLLLTMIFVGQTAFASSVPCMSMSNLSDLAMDSAHAGHHMEPGVSSSTENDCCGDGYCSVSGCISPIGLADTASFPKGFVPNRLWFDAAVSSPIHLSSPDFRPPISS